MIDLEERLSAELGVLGGAVAERAVDLDRPRHLARRRRRNRRLRWSAVMAVLVVSGVGAVAGLATVDSRVSSV